MEYRDRPSNRLQNALMLDALDNLGIDNPSV